MLVVDDDAALAEMLSIVLRNEGFDPIWCAHGDKALAAFRDSKPDLVLLDLMLPGRDGVDVCRDIRAESGVPIVMLTAKTDTIDVVDGPGGGRRRLRRQAVQGQGAGRPDQDPAAAVAAAGGDRRRDAADRRPVDQRRRALGEARTASPIQLTPLEFDLLLALARRPWQVFSREVLLEQVWGYRHAADTRLVNVHVQRLRSKIERDPEHPEIVVTVRGIGYKAGETEPP